MYRLMLLLSLALTVGLLSQPVVPAEAAKKKADLPAVAYVNDGGERVYAFRINPNLTLTELDDSPFPTNSIGASSCTVNCQTLAYSPDRHLLFVGTSDGIDVFAVGSTGDLTLKPNSFNDTEIVGVTTMFRDKVLYVYGAARADDELRAFQVANDGSLDELGGSPYPVGDKPQGVSSTLDFLFVANSGPPSISGFQFGRNGSLVNVKTSPVSIGADANDIAAVFSIDSKPKYANLYVGALDNSDIFGLLSSTRAKAPLHAISPYSIDLANAGAGVAVTNDRVIAIEGGGSDVQVFTPDKGNGLEPLGGGTQDAGVSQAAVGATADRGNLLLVVDSTNDEVVLHSLNTKTNVLSQEDLIGVNTSFTNAANGIVVVTP